MVISVRVEGKEGGHRHEVGVTHAGELVTAPFAFSIPVHGLLDTDNVAVNFIEPRAGFHPVITGYSLETTRDVGPDGAKVVVYEAASNDTLTVARIILSFDMPKQSERAAQGANMDLNAGVWVNAKTDDDDVNVTLIYYYHPGNGNGDD